MTRILALDPGLDTGVALFEVFDGLDVPASLIRHFTIGGGVDGLIDAWPLPGRIVVCEAFHDDGRTEYPETEPLEIIGALKAFRKAEDWAEVPRPFDLVTRLNVQGKLQMKNDVLRRGGYHPKHGEVGDGHSRDAIRVGLSYIVNVLNHRPTQLALFPKEDS